MNAALAKEKEKKKLNASNARGLNGMKQKIRKISREYEAEIKRFQEVNPCIRIIFRLKANMCTESRSFRARVRCCRSS